MKYEVEVIMDRLEIRRRYLNKVVARRYFNTSKIYWGPRGARIIFRDISKRKPEVIQEFKP